MQLFKFRLFPSVLFLAVLVSCSNENSNSDLNQNEYKIELMFNIIGSSEPLNLKAEYIKDGSIETIIETYPLVTQGLGTFTSHHNITASNTLGVKLSVNQDTTMVNSILIDIINVETGEVVYSGAFQGYLSTNTSDPYSHLKAIAIHNVETGETLITYE